MTPAREYCVAEQLLSNRPRRAQLKSKQNSMKSRLIGLVLMSVIIPFMTQAWLNVAVLWFGQITSGYVLKRYVLEGGSNRPPYRVQYSYAVKGHTFTNQDSVFQSQYERMPRGKVIQVRFFPPLHSWTVQIVYPYEDKISDSMGSLIWASVLTFAFSSMFWLMFICPIKERFLIRCGLPTIGRVSQIAPSTSGSYMVRYEYAPVKYSTCLSVSDCLANLHSAPKKLRYYAMATQEEVKFIAVGDLVTVLFDPRKPKRGLLYDLSGYRVCV